jgi:hypothetical protein
MQHPQGPDMSAFRVATRRLLEPEAAHLAREVIELLDRISHGGASDDALDLAAPPPWLQGAQRISGTNRHRDLICRGISYQKKLPYVESFRPT